MTRRRLTFVLIFMVALLGVVENASAVVVDMAKTGTTPVEYPTDQGSYAGVALVPGTAGSLQTAGIPTVSSPGPCTDPALTSDLYLPVTGICFHGGSVQHTSETFALTWDPVRRYFATTKEYVQRFLKDVADGSGTLSSPYALTAQYTDGSGRAGHSLLYGGACVDMGTPEHAACDFTAASSTGHNYPANGCPASGTTDTQFAKLINNVCLTDAQIKTELSAMITQENIIGHAQPGYTPTLVLLIPPGVETCLDAAGKLCSASTESAAPAQFCSYHSRITMGPTTIPYIVQPWTALAANTVTEAVEGKVVQKKVPECDEPDAPPIPEYTDAHTLETNLGIRLVSPLSQSHIASITDPELNGWFALNGAEINDNGCLPLEHSLDSVNVGTSAQNPYLLQREFNNAGVMELEPYAEPCSALVVLKPTFVVPSALNEGTVMQLDGSTSPSTLLVPNKDYEWAFGDGTTAVGPSVEHVYAKRGTYTVKLTLTDRGGNTASTTQMVTVIGPPTNTGLPSISDLTSFSTNNVATGDTLEASTGSWTDSPTSYEYRWQDCNAAGNECSNITSMGTTSTYVVAAKDSGHTIRVVVTATNSAGSGTATSAQTAVVDAPYNTTAPTIAPTGPPSAGSAVQVSSIGAWLREPTSYTYQWLDCDQSGGSCAPINGANGVVYTPVAADVGHTLRVEVTASNHAGAGKAMSAQTLVVSPSPTATAGGSSASGGGAGGESAALNVRLQLVPESRSALLRHGAAVKATANKPADGIASITITPNEAKQAGITYRHGQTSVVIGRGTVRGLGGGTAAFHLRLSKSIASKLTTLHRIALTVRLTARDHSGETRIVAVAGRY